MDPNSHLVLLGAAGAGKESSWVLTWSDTSDLNNIAITSAGDAIVSGGILANESFWTPVTYKISKAGAVQFAGRYSNTGAYNFGGTAIATNGDLYQVADNGNIAKRNSAFSNITSTKYYQINGNTCGVVSDSSGNLYIGSTGNYIYSVNSNLSLRWAKKFIHDGNRQHYTNTLTMLPDGNVAATYWVTYGTGDHSIGVVVLSASNGSVVSSARGNSSGYPFSIDQDASHYYLSGLNDSTGTDFIAKYLKSNGSIVWSRTGSPAFTSYSRCVRVDPVNGDVYSSANYYLSAYTSTGTLKWHRYFNKPIGGPYSSIKITDKSIYVAGQNGWVGKFSKDVAPPVGTYGSLTISNPGSSYGSAGVQSMSSFSFTAIQDYSSFTQGADTNLSAVSQSYTLTSI